MGGVDMWGVLVIEIADRAGDVELGFFPCLEPTRSGSCMAACAPKALGRSRVLSIADLGDGKVRCTPARSTIPGDMSNPPMSGHGSSDTRAKNNRLIALTQDLPVTQGHDDLVGA